MSIPTTINDTGQIVASGTKFFLEKVSLRGVDYTTLELYDGTDAGVNDGTLIATLAATSGASQNSDNINYNAHGGIYAVLTTGASYGRGLLYKR